jgi:hypothetical protein
MKALAVALCLFPAVALAQGLSAQPGTPAWVRAMEGCLMHQGNVPASAAMARCHEQEMIQRRDRDLAQMMEGCQAGAVQLPIYTGPDGVVRQVTCGQYVQHLKDTVPLNMWR